MTVLADNEHYYEVITPEYESSPMRYDPPEPPEYGRDWALVVATSPREAVSLCVRAWLKGKNPCVYDDGPLWGRSYSQRQRKDNANPWAGIRAKIMRCGHGFEYRGEIGPLQELHEDGRDPCPDCDRELHAERVS